MFHANKIKATVLYETGHGNKKRLLNITELEHYVNKYDAVLGLHAFTGCDVASAFKGKVKPLKKMLQSPTFCHALSQLGNSWTLSPGLVTGLGLLQKKCVGGVQRFFVHRLGVSWS